MTSESTTNFHFASALSTAEDPARALDEAVHRLDGAMVGRASVVFVFATPDHADRLHHVSQKLQRVTDARSILGMTVEGVIGTGTEVEEGPGLSVLAGRMPGATLRTVRIGDDDWARWGGAESLARHALAAEDGGATRGLILLADPLTSGVPDLITALPRALSDAVVVGGMASGGRSRGDHRILVDGDVYRHGGVALSIGGDVSVRSVVSQGCRPVGRPMIITGVQDHIITELGRISPAQVLETLINEELEDHETAMIREGGLVLGRVVNEYRDRFGRGDFVIRNLIGMDPQSGAIAVADPELRVGQTVQFQLRDQRTASEDLQLMLEAETLYDPPAGMLLFSCNGRGRRLFDQPHTDARIIGDRLGKTVPMAGAFAGGEIGPLGDQVYIHGQTACLALFRPSSDDGVSDT